MIRRPPRSPLFPTPTLFQPANPPPANPPPAEDTDEPLPGTSTGSKPRTVEVSGPTIDNRYPADSLRFGVGETEICNPYSARDRKSTRLNSSHANISYAVFCL